MGEAGWGPVVYRTAGEEARFYYNNKREVTRSKDDCGCDGNLNCRGQEDWEALIALWVGLWQGWRRRGSGYTEWSSQDLVMTLTWQGRESGNPGCLLVLRGGVHVPLCPHPLHPSVHIRLTHHTPALQREEAPSLGRTQHIFNTNKPARGNII